MPYITLVDPILDAVENKSGTKYYKISLPDGTMVYHADYNDGSNTKNGFYKSYEKAKTNFEDNTSRFNGPTKTRRCQH